MYELMIEAKPQCESQMVCPLLLFVVLLPLLSWYCDQRVLLGYDESRPGGGQNEQVLSTCMLIPLFVSHLRQRLLDPNAINHRSTLRHSHNGFQLLMCL